MVFFDVSPKQGTQYFDGEWYPYPEDLHAIYIDKELTPGTHVRVVRGTKPGDMLFATPNVVSGKFVDVLKSTQATGFKTFPAPLFKDGVQVALFWGLRVQGRGGPFDELRSNADRSESGALHGHSAVYMHETQWDGSDMFFIPGLGISLFVTERIATTMKKAKLLNVQLTVNTECRTGTRIDYSQLRRGAFE